MMNINTNTKSWSWYRAWTNTFFHPNEDTWKSLLYESNVSFRKVYAWLIIVSLLYPLVYTVVAWIKYPENPTNILIFVRNIVLIGIFEPLWFVALTGVIHFLVKLFSKSGVYSNLFITSATSYAPISLLYILTIIIRWLLAFKIGMYAGAILGIYYLTFVLPMIVKFNYQVNLFISLFISVSVAIFAYYFAIAIYATTGFGI